MVGRVGICPRAWPQRARRPARGPIDVLSNEALARLHPTASHPENGERIEVLLRQLDWTPSDATASIAELERCHTREYIERLKSISGSTLFDLDTVATETTWQAVLLSAGIAIDAARRGAFAVVRPPGHHALRAQAMGFCFVNNVAVAARALQADGAERVAIVDFDVHHGNGTEAIFRHDPTVLYASLHEWPFYPGTGGPEDQDETTINVPLPAGSGDDDYLDVFDATIAPAVERFEPGVVLVSAGFDAHEDDPLAWMQVTEHGFRELARKCAALAPRVAAVLEGGYNLETLPRLANAALEGFAS